MATTVNSDMIVYNQLAQTAYLERIQDNLNVFNAASSNAIRFVSKAIQGDLSKESFYKVGGSLVHRDVNSTAAVTGSKIAAGEMVGVKTPWKYGPYESTSEQFKRRARSPEEFAMLVGEDLADAAMAGRLNYAKTALMAAIGGNAAMNASAVLATDGKKSLTKLLRTMGDQSGRIAIMAMSSSTYFDFVDNAMDAKVYEEAGVVIYGGLPGTLGKPVLVSDQFTDGKVMGLQAGAVTITESQAPEFAVYPIYTQENLAIAARAEGTYNIELLGYSWDETKGINPTLAALGTAANWKKYATSNKNTAGGLLTLTAAP